MKSTIYVVGGGIIGLLTAYELAAANQEVAVIDRQSVGREASWAGGGILSPLFPWRYPQPVQKLAGWSQDHYQDLTERLLAETAIDAEWMRCGLLIIDEPDIDVGFDWCRTHSIVANLLKKTEIVRIEPRLRETLRGALNLPGVAQVRNPRLLKALNKALRTLGVDIKEQIRVTGFQASNGNLRSILTDSGSIPAERCVLAAGAWSSELLAKTGIELPVRPVKGQMLLLQGPDPAPFRHILLADGCYLVPRRDGQILVGSTQEDTGFDKSTTETARNMLFAKAIDLVPELRGWHVEQQWAGLRPGSPDGIPYIGAHPEIKGLYINSGHFRNGIVMAPASARLAADMVLGRTPFLDPDQFRVSRK